MIDPKQINFEYTAHGKPKLADSINSMEIEFNVSHSEKLIVYAITCQDPIGVDIEYIQPLLNVEKIAKRFFSTQEFKKLKYLNNSEKNLEFLKLWTGKEAYLKATGEGISQGLDKVQITTNHTTKIIGAPYFNYLPWKIISFVTQSNYLISIATLDKERKIYYWKV